MTLAEGEVVAVQHQTTVETRVLNWQPSKLTILLCRFDPMQSHFPMRYRMLDLVGYMARESGHL